MLHLYSFHRTVLFLCNSCIRLVALLLKVFLCRCGAWLCHEKFRTRLLPYQFALYLITNGNIVYVHRFNFPKRVFNSYLFIEIFGRVTEKIVLPLEFWFVINDVIVLDMIFFFVLLHDIQ